MMTMKKLAPLLALLLFGAGCTPGEDPVGTGIAEDDPGAYQVWRRPYLAADGDVQIHFTRPGTDRGEEEDPEADDAIAEAIESATSSIDLCLYEFNRPLIVEAAVAAAERGITVRFAGDGDELEDEGYIALEEAGVELAVRKPRDRIMHNKFAVIDEQVVFTGSMNFSQNGVTLNNNHVLRIENDELATIFAGEMDQMYAEHKFGRKKESLPYTLPVRIGTSDSEVYFSPQDGIDERIRDVLNAAQTRVFFMIFSYTHENISNDMIALHDAGIDVVGVFDESQARGRYSVDEKMAQAGVPVFIDGNENNRGFAGGKLHHKVMLIDPGTADPVVVLGSYNWSNSATHYNDENVMILRGAEFVQPFVEEFCNVLSVATPHPEFDGERADPCATLLTPVRINEVMPNPAGPDAENEWVELVNLGTAPLNLEGWQLGDGAFGDRHVFGKTILQPDSSIVVYAGPNADEPQRYVSSSGYLGLANNADEVILRDVHGVVVDKMAYKGALSGISFNRNPDGAADGDFVLHTDLDPAESSPGFRVDGIPWEGITELTINEVFPNPTGTDSGQEFVELVNTGTVAVDLAGWRIGDAQYPERHIFSEGKLLPGEAIVVFDEGDHSSIANAVNSTSSALSLNNTGDTITVYDPVGRPVDVVSYTSSTEGSSLTRAVDADRTTALVDHDTVSGALGGSSPGVRVDGSLFTADTPSTQVTINELLPDPEGSDTGEEFVEIFNTGTQTVDLTGWQLHDSVVLRHTFDSLTLLPGEAVVVYDSGTHAGAEIATSGSLSLNNSGDSIRLYDADGNLVDTALYQSSRSGLSLNRSTDLEHGAELVDHDEVPGAVGAMSPGTRADGT